MEILTPATILVYLLIGLIAGALGGLLGIGGGSVMVPSLNLVLGWPYHLAVASSLFCMVWLSTASTYGHKKNGYILTGVIVRLIPVSAVSGVLGVFLSGVMPKWIFYVLFAVFLFVTAYSNILRLVSREPEEEPVKEFTSHRKWVAFLIAVPMGLSQGILGIGGGVVGVPALHAFLKLPLKNAIANSSATIMFSAALAAITKLRFIEGLEATLESDQVVLLHWYHAAIIGGCMALTALVAARVGAHLTKRLPTRTVRAIFVIVLLWGGYKYARKSIEECSNFVNNTVNSAIEAEIVPESTEGAAPGPAED
ncbi:MAG: sulfite exporter TauE/SafE family protein [Planctomycetota bacterium]